MRKSRFISLILALTILCSFAVNVFASNTLDAVADGKADKVDNVKPSVVRKDIELVPETVEVIETHEDGTTSASVKLVYATLVEADLSLPDPFSPEYIKLVEYLSDIEIIVTPYSERENVQSELLSEDGKVAIKENLEVAYFEINGVYSLAELNEVLDPRAAKINPEYDGRVFVVTDLFDITVVDKYQNALTDYDGYFLKVTVNVGLNADSVKPVVMHAPSTSDGWEVLDDKQVVVNDDYSLTMYFDSLCPVAILMPVEERMNTVDPHPYCNCPSWCPFCSFACKNSRCLCWLCWVILIAIVVLLSWYICKQVKKTKNEEEAKRQYQAKLRLEEMELKDKWDEINSHLDK